ncbi:MAG: phenylalanine--tRNA ligase subunit alpha [Deltaproteobacteria bacterium]|jgi:phenylalanyl-tRNA synthetase alpha chain|nr:phenylalanine--tRNA ligase subunit alpha [Deltaproteobacteria bacterium]
MDPKEFLEKVKSVADGAGEAFASAAGPDGLEEARVKYLGSKGLLGEVSRLMGGLDKAARPEAGRALNEAREAVAAAFSAAKGRLDSGPEAAGELTDVTLPGRREPVGHTHLISRTSREICAIFEKMGFTITEGPEVETDYYNFEALNFPKDHPSRDMQQSLFLEEGLLLRTHTSGVQIRTMEKTGPPVWIVVPGKTYRRDDDLTHSPMFNQIEGLAVDRDITMADLKGVLTEFARKFFSESTRIRLRPSFFPFTEPSAEVDIACIFCGGDGCRVCKGSGWLEVLGCGMVDPALYRFVGYDPDEVSGFAFGIGVDRMAMLKYRLDNIGRFYSGDVRIMRQFPG